MEQRGVPEPPSPAAPARSQPRPEFEVVPRPATATGGLTVEGLVKRFYQLTAVNELSMTVRPGEILALLGPNGAGKTTTLLCLAGLLRPDAGTIAWDGRPLGVGRTRQMALIPETPEVYEMLTVWEHLVFVARSCKVDASWPARAERLLERLEQALRTSGPGGVHLAAAGDEDQVLPDRQHLVDFGRLRDQRHLTGAPNPQRPSVPGDRPRIGSEEPRQAEQGGRLARPVRAQKGQDLARADGHRKLVDRGQLVEALDQALDR